MKKITIQLSEESIKAAIRPSLNELVFFARKVDVS